MVPDVRLMRTSGMFLNAHMDLVLYSVDDLRKTPGLVNDIVKTRIREHTSLAPQSCLLWFVGVYSSDVPEDVSVQLQRLKDCHNAIHFELIERSAQSYRSLAADVFNMLSDPIVDSEDSTDDLADASIPSSPLPGEGQCYIL